MNFLSNLLCEHKFGEIRCCKEYGHSGVHADYSPTYAHNLSSTFMVRTWNDDCETELPELFKEFPIDYDRGDEARRDILRAVIADAKKNLPEGTVFEVRAKLYPADGGKSTDFGTKHMTRRDMAKDWGMCWYVVPKQPKGFEHLETATEPLVEHLPDEGEWDPVGGYVLLARVKV